MAHLITEAQKFGYELLKRQLKASKGEAELETLLKAYKGDFWQNGTATLLPPARLTTSLSNLVSKSFENRYVSRNLLKECTERVSSAFFGKVPDFRIVIDNQEIDVEQLELALSYETRKAEAAASNTPFLEPLPDETLINASEELLKQLKDITKVIKKFWVEEAVASILAQAFEHRLITTRGGSRIYIISRYMKKKVEGEASVGQKDLVQAKDIYEAAAAIKIETVDPAAGRYMYEEGEQFSIVTYEKRESYDTEDTVKIIEFSFVDDSNMTFIGVLREGDQETPIAELVSTGKLSQALNLDANTTYYEFTGDPYISQQFFQANKLVNLALTCGGFNIIENGFGEIFTTNVDIQTERVPDPRGSGEMVEIPKKLERGGAVVNNLLGIESVDDMGRESVATPGVHFKPPSPMQTFIDGKQLGYEACLEEAGQKHALINGDATTSGISRIQAMADFYLKIRKYKPEVDSGISWALTVVLRLIAELTGNEELKRMSIIAESKIIIGPLSLDERKLVLEMQKAGTISQETARVLLEIPDPEKEAHLVLQEKAKSAATMVKAVGAAKSEVDGDGSDDPNPNPTPQPVPGQIG